MPFPPVLLLLLLGACCPTLAQSHQSGYQIALFNRITSDAKQASDAATPALLDALQQQDFQTDLLACCPSIANYSAQQLLQLLHDEISVTEVVTGFPGTQLGNVWWDFSLTEAAASNFSATTLENQWEVAVKHSTDFNFSWAGIQDDVETQIYGLKAFSHRGTPASIEEAHERGVYNIVNTARVDMGSVLYGDVSAVLSREYIGRMTLLSAVDTGGWTYMCNSTDPKSPYQVDCDGYQFALGTLGHLDHLILANTRFWQGQSSLASVFARLVRPWGVNRILGKALPTYWEAVPAGELVFPDAVHFVIGSFVALFGTNTGRLLQQWCTRWGWVLVWSLGLNLNQDPNFC
eukprot:TRINITY_DN4228_c0_g1_i5.p1 TRINITY_DN4228_c0_g1~~TRINITY_DN4228_c0_g1_i5.p1  ORF type:complete len:348 (-),score=79.69 TRINITY_DN4228_c0_g1_i5:831-1874(-)